ncbi:MAG: diguanylate cyclase [Bauldia sp.]|nr:diguanylate cyclase [Bauldia sp.]
MDVSVDVLTAAGRGLARMAFVVLIYASIWHWLRALPLLRQVAVGLLFGLATIFSTLEPGQFTAAIIVDVRGVPLILAAPLGGPVALVVAAIVAAAYAALAGDPNLWSTVAAIVAVSAVSLVWYLHYPRQAADLRWRDLMLLGALSGVWFLAIIATPWTAAAAAVMPQVATLAVLAALGVILMGAMLVRERRRLRAEARIRALALTDALTGLPNRRAFQDELTRAIGLARRTDTTLALLTIDLDHFKEINDRYGHAAGDETLTAFGRRLIASLRQGDFAARVGGEEFAVLMQTGGAAGAQAYAERLLAMVRAAPIRAARQAPPLTISIGIASGPGAEIDEDWLVAEADRALYAAKEGGRDQLYAAPERSPDLEFPSLRIAPIPQAAIDAA